jgi:hypothetical protein
MRKPPISQRLNNLQRAAGNSLKQNTLKTGDFGKASKSALGAGALPPGESLDSIT